MEKAWWKWVKIVKIVVGIQTSIFLFVVYYLLVVPLSFLVKIFSKKTFMGHNYKPKERSLWSIRDFIKYNLLWARSQ